MTMFTIPKDTVQPYNPEGRPALVGPCPPKGMRPTPVPKKLRDDRMLGHQSPSRDAKDHLIVHRCRVCKARWIEPLEPCSCTCPTKE